METVLQTWCSCSHTTSLLLPAHKDFAMLKCKQTIQGKKYQHKLLCTNTKNILMGTI